MSADKKGTREVHEKMDMSKHMLFQSVRLVGAAGIEPTSEAWEVLNIAIPFSSQRQVARLKCKSIVVQ